jgi:hypothetical protein
MTPRLAGKRMSMIMVPDRAKVDALKHKRGGNAGAKSQPKSAAAASKPRVSSGQAPPQESSVST